MTQYLIRRFLISIVTLVAISIVVFGILSLAPGDPLGEFATNPSVPVAVRQQIRKQMGLDDPISVQYVKWGQNYIQGNWMRSFTAKSDVRPIVLGRLPTTIYIIGSSFLLSLLIAIPIGVLSAIKQYSVFDQASTTFAFLGFSLPTFFTGLLFITLFSVKLGWLPFVYDSTTHGFFLWIKQAIMPISVLALFSSASLTRFVRASMLEVINQDYVRTARAKGLRERVVIVGHAMRNGMIPVVTIIALQIPEVFGGAIVTEQIFRVPGIGSLLIASVNSKDTPVIMAITFGIAIIVVVCNVFADVLYALLDPRIKLS